MSAGEFFADLLMLLHAGFALFVMAGLIFILLGLALGWKWTRHKWFLRTHLAATLFVVARVWIGLPCPLSAAEDRLRLEVSSPCLFGQPMHDGLHRLAFRGKDPQGFATATTVFGAFVLAAFVCADRRLPKVREA
jgi:hypothetical protein